MIFCSMKSMQVFCCRNFAAAHDSRETSLMKGHFFGWVSLGLLPLCIAELCLAAPAQTQTYTYIRAGESEPAHTKYEFGIAMMGGGSDLDEAFRWLCTKASGGDLLVLRAHGDDEYNSYIAGLCRLNSVATLVIPDRGAAHDARVADIIRSAQAIFIAGGDQSRYINFWQGTPVQGAINANISEGKPIGGTSAGLAVLGEFIYGALQDREDDKDLAAPEVLRNPYSNRVTLVRNFLQLSLLQNTLTDSHFMKRDRLGRSLGFLARIAQDGWSAHPREIAIDERSAVLVEGDGSARVIGRGRGAYFLSVTQPPEVCKPGIPLTIRSVAVYHARAASHFDLKSWIGQGGESYSVSVVEGQVRSNKGKKR
jgi:cyanophycinase